MAMVAAVGRSGRTSGQGPSVSLVSAVRAMSALSGHCREPREASSPKAPHLTQVDARVRKPGPFTGIWGPSGVCPKPRALEGGMRRSSLVTESWFHLFLRPILLSSALLLPLLTRRSQERSSRALYVLPSGLRLFPRQPNCAPLRVWARVPSVSFLASCPNTRPLLPERGPAHCPQTP